MLNQLLGGELPAAFAQAQNSPYIARLKKLLLVLLGLWMAYFLLVNWFVHSLNRIAVPDASERCRRLSDAGRLAARRRLR